jgi:hypothetical protein
VTAKEVQLIDREAGFQLGFIEHRQNLGEPFDEFMTGLDHIEFENLEPSRVGAVAGSAGRTRHPTFGHQG